MDILLDGTLNKLKGYIMANKIEPKAGNTPYLNQSLVGNSNASHIPQTQVATPQVKKATNFAQIPNGGPLALPATGYQLSPNQMSQISMQDIANNPAKFANYDFTNAEPGQYGTDPFDIGSNIDYGQIGTDQIGSNFDFGGIANGISTGIGALGSAFGAYQQWEANKYNMESAKREEARRNKEIARLDNQRSIIGSALDMGYESKNQDKQPMTSNLSNIG